MPIPRFQTQEMFLAVTLIAAGCGLARFMWGMPDGPLRLLWLVVPALIGAGVFAPARRMFDGALLGLLGTLVVLFVWAAVIVVLWMNGVIRP